MTEVSSNTAPKKPAQYAFSNTHFHLLIVADDQKTQAAIAARGQRDADKVCVFVDLDSVKETHGRARGIAVDKKLATAARAYPDAKLVVTVSVPAAFTRSMVDNQDNAISRGALQNIIDGLLGFRTLGLLDSIMVYASADKTSLWDSPSKPTWANLQHPNAEQKPVPKPASSVRLKSASITDVGGKRLRVDSMVESISAAAEKGIGRKLGGKLASIGAKPNGATPALPLGASPWLAFGWNEGPEDDRNQHVAFDSLFDHMARYRQGAEVLSLDEVVETARLITSLEGSAAPHEISNKQTLARLIGAVRRSLAGDHYRDQLNDLLFALKSEQAGGNDLKKQISMVVETGSIKYYAAGNRRPLLPIVFAGLHRRVKGALRKRKQVADQKQAPVAPAPVVEAPAKKKKKRKKKVKKVSDGLALVQAGMTLSDPPLGVAFTDANGQQMVGVPLEAGEGCSATAVLTPEEAAAEGVEIVSSHVDVAAARTIGTTIEATQQGMVQNPERAEAFRSMTQDVAREVFEKEADVAFESRFAAKILDTDQPALSEQEYQARKQQLQEAQK